MKMRILYCKQKAINETPSTNLAFIKKQNDHEMSVLYL